MLSIAKYTYGYNIQLQSTVSANHLSALTVDANMLNTFNITLFIQIIVLVSSLGLYVYRRVCS